MKLFTTIKEHKGRSYRCSIYYSGDFGKFHKYYWISAAPIKRVDEDYEFLLPMEGGNMKIGQQQKRRTLKKDGEIIANAENYCQQILSKLS